MNYTQERKMRIQGYCQLLLVSVVMLVLWGCGGSSSQPGAGNKFIGKSVLATVNPNVGGIEMTLVLPAGVTVNADSNGLTQTGVVTVMAPNDVTTGNGSVMALYTPAAGTSAGKVSAMTSDSRL